jgi:DNA-binding MarR family transcriptional regulator/predicted N-acetyltransferase YhbS
LAVDVMDELGELAFASRLKRLSERLFRDGSEIYRDHAVEFEAKWFPVLYLLGRESPLPLTDVARALRLTHPAVSRMASEMTSRGLVRSEKDPGDERKRLLCLTGEGKELRKRLEPVWCHIAEATRELIGETGHDLLGALETMERSLDRRNMRERVRKLSRRRQIESVEIVGYAPELAGRFRELNEQWLRKDFTVEGEDRKVLDDPGAEIVDRGGAVLFARIGERVVGTCALVRREEGEFELAKMAVDEEFRGRQVGRRLLLAAINRARYAGARRLYLHTSDKLTAANHLYRTAGFVRATREEEIPHRYDRPTFTMLLDLDRQLPFEQERKN